MQRMLSTSIDEWDQPINFDQSEKFVDTLEDGKVLNFPKLEFETTAEEKSLFSPQLVDKNRKNLSYSLSKDSLKGFQGSLSEQEVIHQMMKRFASLSSEFVKRALFFYKDELEIGRTSFRPVEIEGRVAPSYRKDDTLLHIDAFPSSPTNGKRILRFFANVNPFEKPRVWKVGEPYQDVFKRFILQVKPPTFGSRALMNRLGITKSYRSLYDHYMLKIHHQMKADQNYQKNVDQEIIEFPTHSSWMAFTDQVSHAVLSGQYVFEQSFYLPLDAHKQLEKAPLSYMQELLKKKMDI